MIHIPPVDLAAHHRKHGDEITAAVARVLKSGWYVLGEEVAAFEREFAAEFGYGYAVGAASGTDAIALCLRAQGVGPGDKVATVSHTAVATVVAIEMAGAQPVLVDIDPASYTLAPASLARALETFHPVKAVIAVHLYGHPADLEAIVAVARHYDAQVIEDCAQAHGARLDGHYVGTRAAAAAFSFYPTKNLGALGDAGMAVAADAECAQRMRWMREYGWKQRYISEIPGVNSRLDELQAAVLRVKLRHLEGGNQRRAVIAAAYDRGLAHTGLVLPVTRSGARHVFHQYVVRSRARDALRSNLRERGVGTSVHYPLPVHQQPAYAGRVSLDPGGLEETERAAREVLSLPMYPELTDAAVESVIAAVRASV
jgi:dTDP-4-amino-4,6-dideoxygalactose transaminase